MRVLALDAATEACSVALLDGDTVIGRHEEIGRGHADRILGMVDEGLAQAGMRLAALDGIAASIGPGSFTGVRISVAVAQGLAYGADLLIAPVSTLEALALHAVNQGAQRVLACLDARMGEVYWGCFATDASGAMFATTVPQVGVASTVSLPHAGIHQGIGRGFGAHDALRQIPGVVFDARSAAALPNAREIARLGAVRLGAGGGRAPAALEPLYLRDKVALTEFERGVNR